MKSFESYILDNEVIQIRKDINLSKSLIEDSKHRFEYYINQKIDENNSKFIFENCYEAIRELLDALLAIHGYKSYSHQAPIVFARDKQILNDQEAIILDSLRDKRNKSKYYGKKIDVEFVKTNIHFLRKVFNQILNTLKNLIT